MEGDTGASRSSRSAAPATHPSRRERAIARRSVLEDKAAVASASSELTSTTAAAGPQSSTDQPEGTHEQLCSEASAARSVPHMVNVPPPGRCFVDVAHLFSLPWLAPAFVPAAGESFHIGEQPPHLEGVGHSESHSALAAQHLDLEFRLAQTETCLDATRTELQESMVWKAQHDALLARLDSCARVRSEYESHLHSEEEVAQRLTSQVGALRDELALTLSSAEDARSELQEMHASHGVALKDALARLELTQRVGSVKLERSQDNVELVERRLALAEHETEMQRSSASSLQTRLEIMSAKYSLEVRKCELLESETSTSADSHQA